MLVHARIIACIAAISARSHLATAFAHPSSHLPSQTPHVFHSVSQTDLDTPGDAKKGDVAIVGPPNAGKSTLLNRLLGYSLAAVHRKAQTTRRPVLGQLQGDTGDTTLRLIDTPGVTSKEFYTLHRWMNREIARTLSTASLVLFVTDIFRGPNNEAFGSESCLRRFLLDASHPTPLIVAVNKCDLLTSETAKSSPRSQRDVVLVWKECLPHAQDVLAISASDKSGLDALRKALRPYSVRSSSDVTTSITSATELEVLKTTAYETLRESLLDVFSQEVPYCIEPEITCSHIRPIASNDASSASLPGEKKPSASYEREVIVEARLHISKASLMGMVIGKEGKTIQKLEAQASTLLLTRLQSHGVHQVTLRLIPVVSEKWRDTKEGLRRLHFCNVE